MKINIQKEKAIKRERIMRGSWVFIGTIMWFLILNGGYFLIKMMDWNSDFHWKFSYLIYSFIFMVIYEYVYYRFFLEKINSLKYEMDEKENRLLKSWKIILKHKDTAKLQVINSVDINQDIWDKFVDLYSVNVCYGFSEGGYNYVFDYLSEEDAEDILSRIKPSGRSKIDLE